MTVVHVDDYGAAGDGVTDDTAAINLAIDQIRTGRDAVIQFGAKDYLASSLNFTGMTGFEVRGEGIPINDVTHPRGTRILPASVANPLLDLTGSGGFLLNRLQLGKVDAGGNSQGQCAIFAAPIDGQPRQDNIFIEQVHVTGEWSAAALYMFGVGDSGIIRSRFWKYGGGVVGIFSQDNVYGLASAYQTVATGFQPCGNFGLTRCQFHDFNPPNNTSGACLWLRGVGSMLVDDCLLDSATTAVGHIFASQINGTDCEIEVRSSEFYSETPGKIANYNYFVSPGTLFLHEANNRYSHGVGKTSGSVVYV